LGTGGGLLLAKEAINQNQPFLLLNGDTFFEVDLKKLLNFHMINSSGWTFSLYRSEEKGRYMGMNISAGGNVLSLHSNSNKQNKLINGGVYLVNPLALSEGCFIIGKKYSLEEEILPKLINSGLNMFGCEFLGQFIDIGVPNDYLKANELFISK
jgi:D-glycero-alpha-D-manno-heptose 1-phosphate guanylyltransferase